VNESLFRQIDRHQSDADEAKSNFQHLSNPATIPRRRLHSLVCSYLKGWISKDAAFVETIPSRPRPAAIPAKNWENRAELLLFSRKGLDNR